MEIAAVLVAGLALLVSTIVAVRGERRANRTEGRAERAEQRAERAEAAAEQARLAQLWGELIKQVHRWVNVNVLTTDMSEPLNALRTAAVELVDGAPRDQWPDLDAWLRTENALGVLLARSALEQLGPTPSPHPDAVFAAHEDLHLWAATLLQNTRHMRNIGACDESRHALPLLVKEAQSKVESVCERHGWDEPTRPERIKPLETPPSGVPE